MTIKKIAILMGAFVAVSACVPDPRAYESEPVELQTSGGVVTCQLYTRERVIWDRSINRPSNMSVEQADEYCQAEGLRQQQES